MRKKRILFCSEATFLNTGYATYTREILKYLHSTNKYEIAEMASYGHRHDPRGLNLPWKYYGVAPDDKCSKEEHDAYNSIATNQFGEFIFNDVCLDFKPDVVCDIRDFWMLDFVERSPFRNFFKWAIMPTVDAAPQARQWIATYANADACFTYSDWAGKVLTEQSGGRINYLGSSPPSADPAYKPIENKEALRQSLGLSPNAKIIGTVMRNQRRKLYPDLFVAFKKFLSLVPDPENYFLYCHTSYPDLGWDLPELIQENELASKVYFTYICPETKQPFPSLFRGAITVSPFTQKYGATVSSVKNGASYEHLSMIMNLFDLYVQYANCEGFGLPQVEAAACGIPVMSTDYSAMESVIRQLGGTPLTPKALYKELETGCMRAVPDNDFAAQKFLEFFNKTKEEREELGKRTRELFEKNFQWHISGGQWEKYFDSIDIIPDEKSWKSPPRIAQSAPPLTEDQLNGISDYQQLAQWLISEVLREPEKLNTFMEARLTRDLTYKTSTSNTGGMYYNESSAAFDGKRLSPFSFEDAYKHFVSLCERRNHWEQRRIQAMNV